jgi:hypothetical protein
MRTVSDRKSCVLVAVVEVAWVIYRRAEETRDRINKERGGGERGNRGESHSGFDFWS